MKLATILPLRHLLLETDNDYHMALAHLVGRSFEYDNFFRWHSDRGDYVIMDNGVVEGSRRSVPELVAAAEVIGATEVILPDEIGSAFITLDLSHQALEQMQLTSRSLMAVPHGATLADWEMCLHEMLTWPISTIGVSKFVTLQTGLLRDYLVSSYGDEIEAAGKMIHLLGSPSGADELRRLSSMVRGADTGYPSFCTAGGVKVRRDGRRPDAEVNWLADESLDESLMAYNYAAWRKWVGAT